MPPDTLAGTYERRAFAILTPESVRAEGETPGLSGYAALFDTNSQDLGGFTEDVAPGAFKETITHDDIRGLWNHNPDVVLGRNRAQTLRLTEDAKGLAFELDLPDTQAARDLLTSVKRGDVSQMSFGFQTIDDEWSTRDGLAHRRLVKVRLFDISPVTYPAYLDTSVGTRALPFGYGQDADIKPPAGITVEAPDLGTYWARLHRARMP